LNFNHGVKAVFAGVWAMARVLLPRLLGRRGKALVAAVDGWLKPKKA
jgi:ABC-type thiamin/hydroxymethylpyrimidine transport system permease subunit